MIDQTIHVAIVDDHGIVRQGLRALLTKPGIEVVGEADCGPAAVDLARSVKPHVMLLDIRMSGGDGLHYLPQIKSASPDTSVIILTTYANPGYLARSIQDGAAGYLSKDVDPNQVVRAVQAVAAGEELIDRTLLRAALSHTADTQTAEAITDDDLSEAVVDDPLIEDLSEREVDVLRLMAKGMSNAAIADALHVSISTVKTHVRHILEKLNVSDRTQAALWAVKNNLIM